MVNNKYIYLLICVINGGHILSVISDATLYYHSVMNSAHGMKAKRYLKEERGLYGDTITKYSLGTSSSYYGLYNHLIKTHKHEDIVASRLVKMESSTFLFRDFFYNTIILPIFKNGVPAHITSRALITSDESERAGNGGGNLIHKHLHGDMDYLFNMDILTVSTKYVVLCEAPIDCLTLLQQGVPAVSAFGSFKISNTKYFPDDTQVYIMYDNDEDKNKGPKAALKIAWLLYKHRDIVAKVVTLPITGDVNEMWIEDKKHFLSRIHSSLEESVLYSSLDTFRDNVKSLERNRDRVKLNKEVGNMLKVVRKIPIVRLVKQYLPVYSASGTPRVNCPFHGDDKTDSLILYEDTNSFFCFGAGCNVRGDQIQFVQYIEKISFVEAVNKLYEEWK